MASSTPCMPQWVMNTLVALCARMACWGTQGKTSTLEGTRTPDWPDTSPGEGGRGTEFGRVLLTFLHVVLENNLLWKAFEGSKQVLDHWLWNCGGVKNKTHCKEHHPLTGAWETSKLMTIKVTRKTHFGWKLWYSQATDLGYLGPEISCLTYIKVWASTMKWVPTPWRKWPNLLWFLGLSLCNKNIDPER